MKRIIATLDEYFLSDDPEEIAQSDRLTLYGFYFTIVLMSIVLAIKLYSGN